MSDRKYRQSGYQDEDRERSGQRGRRGSRPSEGPSGRGLGAPTRSISKCFRCGARLGRVPGPRDTCKRCASDLHTCTNCKHFDTSAPNECREPVETRIAAKSKNNECQLFAPRVVQVFAADSSTEPSKRDAKAAFDDLFDF